MRGKSIFGCALAAGTLLMAACSNGNAVPAAPSFQAAQVRFDAGKNVIKNPCFDTGKLAPWVSVGKAPGQGAISNKETWDCKYAALMGTTKPPAVDGLHGIEQKVTIPSGGKLTWWYYAGSNDEAKYADDEVDLQSGGKTVYQCFKKLEKTTKWTQGTCDLSKYAGKQYDLVFGVNDNGYAKTYVYWYVDDISLTSG